MVSDIRNSQTEATLVVVLPPTCYVAPDRLAGEVAKRFLPGLPPAPAAPSKKVEHDSVPRTSAAQR